MERGRFHEPSALADDPDARAIDLNRLDAEGAEDRGHRQIEPDGVRLEERDLIARCGHRHPIETDRQRGQVVVQTRRLEADAVPRQLGGRPRQYARPHEREMDEGVDEDEDDGDRHRDDPPAAHSWHLRLPSSRPIPQRPLIVLRSDVTAERSGALGASFRNISK